MTTQIGASVFVDPTEIRHDIADSGTGVLTFGPYPTVGRVDLFLGNVACIDAVIAELVALKQEMDPPVPSGCGEIGPDGYVCTRHDGGSHVAWAVECEAARWPIEADAPERETAGSAA